MAWVLLFALLSWTGTDGGNVLMISPVWLPPGPLKYVTHAIAQIPQGLQALALLVAPWLLVVLSAIELWRPGKFWRAALVWWLHTNLMNTAWLAGSGGQQLIANVLFWNILLCVPERWEGTRLTAFWIVRLQLLLAYLATGLHKLTGVHWLDGTAMGIVATDHAFGPLWMADHPSVAAFATWVVLAFQLTFPIAVWWRRTRYVWMFVGVVFHLGTAIWMDIPEMGLAFIAVYPIWFAESDLLRYAPAFLRRGGPA